MTISNNGETQVLEEIFNAGAGAFPAADAWLSLHSADPGETGTNEVTGGSYGRQQVAMTVTGNTVTNDAIESFSGMPAGDVVGWGIWDASVAGNCFWTGWFSTVGRVGVVDAAGITSNDIISPAHGVVADDRIVLEAIEGETTPTGITAGTLYYVLSAGLTTDTFNLSATSGGAEVDISAKGVGLFRKVTVTTLGAGNTFQVAAGDLDIFID